MVRSYSGPSDSSPIKAPGPSGRLQVLEPKDFPYLHTGKSLVFVIASNGYVFGKRLDEQSGHHDIELEVFWPSERGCLVSRPTGYDMRTMPKYFSKVESLDPFLKNPNSITTSQREKILSILAQKEIIQYELGTLMVQPFVPFQYTDWRRMPQYQKMTEKCKLDFSMGGEPCNIKVVDCTYGNKSCAISGLGIWLLDYDSKNLEFGFFSQTSLNSRKSESTFAPNVTAGIEDINVWVRGRLDEQYTTRFYAVRAENKQFNVSEFGSDQNKDRFKPTLKIMYGEHDFFEYFAIDDAVLLLEENFAKKEKTELCWTLGVAQSRHVREMMRLASNNPDLFKPLIPKVYREGGKKS